MTDYCVICGDTEASKQQGEYLEFHQSKYNLYIERFVCYSCLGKGEIYYD